MVTKSKLAKMIIGNFADNEGVQPSSITQKDIFKDSSLAVAMEYLGLLNGDCGIYAPERGGTVLSYYDKANDELLCLSMRELFNLLPE